MNASSPLNVLQNIKVFKTQYPTVPLNLRDLVVIDRYMNTCTHYMLTNMHIFQAPIKRLRETFSADGKKGKWVN